MEDAFSSSTRVIIAVRPVNRLLVARQKKSRRVEERNGRRTCRSCVLSSLCLETFFSDRLRGKS